MARTKEFDTDAALDRAMRTFWAHGFDGTSTQHLVDALGINRSSLYATFGSKKELYDRALRRYGEGAPSWTEILGQDRPVKDALRSVLVGLVEADVAGEEPRGCFACNAAVELGSVDATVRRLVTESFDRVRDLLVDVLSQAQTRGELRGGGDPHALANSLLVTIEGLHVVAQGTADRTVLRDAIDTALSSF